MQNQLLLFYKKYYKTIFDVLLIALTIYLIMWIGSFVYKLAFPILLALLMAAMMRPFSLFLQKRGIHKTIAANISALSFIVIVLAVVVGLGAIFTTQVLQLSEKLPHYIQFFKYQATDKADFFQKQMDRLPPGVIKDANNYFGNISTKLSHFASSILGTIFNTIQSVSANIISLIANFIGAFILAYFLSFEIDWWKRFTRKNTPRTFKKIFFFLRNNVFTGIGKYIRAQMILVSITFFIVLIGLFILGASNAFSLALLSAMFDVLPLLGVPVIFIPWIIYSFVVGHTGFAISLIVVLAVAMLTRQIAEPRIAGNALGVSPFVMLSSMLIFSKIFGISGIILSPILLILIKQLYDKGIIQKTIRKPEGEYEVSAVTEKKINNETKNA